MATLYMTVGLPASGKSTWARGFAKKYDAIHLSSDDLRKEFYGDESVQENHGQIFQEMNRRAKVALDAGKDVILDATNINAKRRKNTLSQFKNEYKKVCVYFDTSIYECLFNDHMRNRHVGYEVIKRMYHGLHVPTKAEGWNEIQIIHYQSDSDRHLHLGDWMHRLRQSAEKIIYGIEKKSSYNDIRDLFYLPEMCELRGICELPHDSKWHSLSVSRHTYHVWEYLYDNYLGESMEDRQIMLWASILHDSGKAETKAFKPGLRYANFIGHENVSAQLVISMFHRIGYTDEFSLQIAEICQFHMRLLSVGEGENALAELKDSVGEVLFNKLVAFREADVQAH